MDSPSNRDSAGRQMAMDERLTEFERENPKVAKAMWLFGMSMAKYQGVLHAMHPARVTQSDATTPLLPDQRVNG